MKKLIAVLTAVGILTTGIYMPNNYNSALVSITASAETSAEDFEFDAETGTITGYNGEGGEIVIPSEIDGVAVTAIGDRAFTQAFYPTNITIPDSVTSIGDYAFSGCESLTYVRIGSSVQTIGSAAFFHCTSLSKVSIPSSVTSIGSSAFMECYRLSSVSIPNSVERVGGHAFYNCTRLTNISIPSSVTEIGDYAFGFIFSSQIFRETVLPNFSITGMIGSEVEKYANENSIKFISNGIFQTTTSAVNDTPTTTTTTTTPVTTVTYSNGDVTGDGIIDATDASFILTAYAKSSTNEDDGMNEEQRTFADVNNDDVVDAVDASTVLTYYARSSVDFKGTFEEYLDEFVFKKEINPDDYFKAEIKTHEISKDTYGNENLTIVFEFTNVTDETIYVNDNEIAPNGTWEKRIFDKTDRWGSMIKHGGYIHYVFSDSEMNKMFSGGLFFKLDENLDVVESRGFLD